jgi:hypothetical protein
MNRVERPGIGGAMKYLCMAFFDEKKLEFCREENRKP